jgi:hypothetical protein
MLLSLSVASQHSFVLSGRLSFECGVSFVIRWSNHLHARSGSFIDVALKQPSSSTNDRFLPRPSGDTRLLCHTKLPRRPFSADAVTGQKRIHALRQSLSGGTSALLRRDGVYGPGRRPPFRSANAYRRIPARRLRLRPWFAHSTRQAVNELLPKQARTGSMRI